MLLLLGCLFVTSGDALGVGREFIALDHWAYGAVERFESLGLCVVPGDRPLTRTEFVALTSEISRAAFDRRLSARDRYNLARLEKEFTEFQSQRDPQARYDPPTFYLDERPTIFEGDLDLGLSFDREFFGADDEWFLASNPTVKFHLSDHVTYEVRYRLLLGPEHGRRARNQRPSRRERSFKGLTSLYERSYVIAGWDRFHVFFGREYVDWGPSEWGSLITPGDRLSLDQIGYRATLKMFRLSGFHAQLSPVSRRYLAGHRLEMTFAGTTIGINETAIYHGKDVDPVYALPLSSFYANQFNERGDDNVLWSVDAKTSLFDAVTLFGSFLVDDFQFERDGVNPDKIAFEIGGRAAVSFPIATTLRARYRYVDIYTFTHNDSGTVYVSGEGRIDEGDVLLGGEPGPDADTWRIEADVFPLPRLTATVALFGERRGVGNDLRPHVPPADPYPPFPLGPAQRTISVGLRGVWELDRNSTIEGFYSRASVDNRGNVVGADEDTDAFRLAVRWDF